MNPTLDNSKLTEFGLIDWIRRQAQAGPWAKLGIGDDCAVLRTEPGVDLLATTDMLMEGRHFLRNEVSARQVGYKALGVNLSDIAAMAGRPIGALVAVALPRSRAADVARDLFEGMKPLADEFEVGLIGGDTNAWDGPLVVSVTLLGQAVAPGPVRRSGARPGDVVLVTGPLGGSLLGRHLRPQPRIREAQALLRTAPLQAMIDISDGLAADLGHILEESGGLGATLDAASIPVHADAVAQASRDGRSALDHALHDGEDFELCLVVGPEVADRLLANPPALDDPGHPDGRCVSLDRVGVIDAEPGLRLRQAGGRTELLEATGFDHLAGGF